jgi:hypothetical protein
VKMLLVGLLLAVACTPRTAPPVNRDRAVWTAVVEHVCPDVNGPCLTAHVRPVGMPGLKNAEMPIVQRARELQRQYHLEEAHLARFLPGCPGPYACKPPSLLQDTLPVPQVTAGGHFPVRLELSQIAYSDDGRTALVSVSVAVGAWGGHDDVVLVQLDQNGVWQVVKVALVVVA